MAGRITEDGREARGLSRSGMALLGTGTLLALRAAAPIESPASGTLRSLAALGWLALLAGAATLAIGHGPAGTAVKTSPPPRSDEAALPAPPPARPGRWSRAVFDLIEWRRFEAVVERLFQQAGFEIRHPPHSVDVWLYSRHQPGAPASLAHYRHWQGRPVGVDEMRELRAVMDAHALRRGQFATPSTFTPEAIAFARRNGINPLDADGLLALIDRRSPHEQAELLAVALDGDYWRPTCVNCGIKMAERQPRRSARPFWGCKNFPECRVTLAMRAA